MFVSLDNINNKQSENNHSIHSDNKTDNNSIHRVLGTSARPWASERTATRARACRSCGTSRRSRSSRRTLRPGTRPAARAAPRRCAPRAPAGSCTGTSAESPPTPTDTRTPGRSEPRRGPELWRAGYPPSRPGPDESLSDTNASVSECLRALFSARPHHAIRE